MIKRSVDSLLTKIEDMQIGDEIFTNKSSGYVSDSIGAIKRQFPSRRYVQMSILTHEGATYHSLKDFKKVMSITRLS